MNSKQWHRWLERWLVIRSHALAARQIKGLEQRLQKAEKALTQLASKPGTDAQSLQEKVNTLLERPVYFAIIGRRSNASH